MCVLGYLLLSQPLLDLLVVTDAVGDGSGQLGLHAAKPRAQVAHVLIQLLHRHQSLLQLLHPEHTHKHTLTLIICTIHSSYSAICIQISNCDRMQRVYFSLCYMD